MNAHHTLFFAGPPGATEDAMKPLTHLVAMVASLILLLNSPSWGQSLVNPTGSDANANTAGGTAALFSVLSGADNTAFGKYALYSDTTGCCNTATGATALENNVTGHYNTATGDSALHDNMGGSNNTATGVNALYKNTASNNTADGFHALTSNTTGSFNTATGVSALTSNDTGSDNTAAGAGALSANTGGFQNTATGFNALSSNTTGNFNTATGGSALGNNVFGSDNTAAGAGALYFNNGGSDNTATGFEALHDNSAGNSNAAFGFRALYHGTGIKNIALGFKAGATLVNGNNNIYIGNQGNGDESQTIRIGTAQAQTFIAGIGNASVIGVPVEVDTTTGQLGIATSSARYKENIAPMGVNSEKLVELRPVSFAYKEDTQHVKHYGLIAEEVATVYPELVTHTATGEAQTVRYQELIPMLLNELQRQRQVLHHQEQELAELRALVGQGRGAEAVIPSATVAANGTASSPPVGGSVQLGAIGSH